MSFTLEFELEDLPALYHSALPAKEFRDQEQTGRFNYLEHGAEGALPDMEFNWPEFDAGSILWFDSTASALMAKKLLQAAGFIAKVMVDNAAEDSHEVYCVLTSWDVTVFTPELTDAPIVAEFMLSGSLEETDASLVASEVKAFVNSFESTELMNEPTLEDHQDHYHLMGMVKLPGIKLESFANSMSEDFESHVSVQIVSLDA